MSTSKEIWKMLEEHPAVKSILTAFEEAGDKAVAESEDIGAVAGLAAMAILCKRHAEMMDEAGEIVPEGLDYPLAWTADAFRQVYAHASAGAIIMVQNMAADALGMKP